MLCPPPCKREWSGLALRMPGQRRGVNKKHVALGMVLFRTDQRVCQGGASHPATRSTPWAVVPLILCACCTPGGWSPEPSWPALRTQATLPTCRHRRVSKTAHHVPVQAPRPRPATLAACADQRFCRPTHPSSRSHIWNWFLIFQWPRIFVNGTYDITVLPSMW